MRVRPSLLLLLATLAGCATREASPTQPALGPPSIEVASTEVRPYLARLVWTVTSGGQPSFAVQRRHADDPWKNWGSFSTDWERRITLEDASVQPGESYTYRVRLGVAPLAYGGEVTILVPTSL